MVADPLAFLQQWYHQQCDGDWEHMYGVRIGTLDNPGWSLEIHIVETSLEASSFDRVRIERTDDDWISCWTEDGFFRGACGPLNLGELLQIFADWASKATSK
jgi:hypothetical protein